MSYWVRFLKSNLSYSIFPNRKKSYTNVKKYTYYIFNDAEFMNICMYNICEISITVIKQFLYIWNILVYYCCLLVHNFGYFIGLGAGPNAVVKYKDVVWWFLSTSVLQPLLSIRPYHF